MQYRKHVTNPKLQYVINTQNPCTYDHA